MQLNKFKVLSSDGEQTDRYQFSNYIMRNLQLEEFRTGYEPDLEATAQYVRSELAEALRKGPYQCNLLLGGYDPIEEEAKLYWLDYLGTLQQVQKGAHGYAGYFVSSVLDNLYKKDMKLEEGLEACRACINELRTRFIINQPNFVAKIVTKDGV
jgi:20S proteasome subunit beta 4